ncbi:MAG TPA: helix-turn-helix transcriptional regulator [Chlorobaculum sp.]|nr:helix-turn-helix transcriptional regulator [Chlorobaculum sp.]
MDKHTFNSAADAFAALAGDENIKERIKEEASRTTIVDGLIRMRIQKGVSQKKLAERMKCTSSKISRFEAGTDDNLKLCEVRDYVSALNIGMTIMFENQEVPAAELIKQHVFAIHEKLECLVKIAEEVDGDEEIVDKIQKFYGDVLFNFLKRFQDSHTKLCMILAPEGLQVNPKESVKLLEHCDT